MEATLQNVITFLYQRRSRSRRSRPRKYSSDCSSLLQRRSGRLPAACVVGLICSAYCLSTLPAVAENKSHVGARAVGGLVTKAAGPAFKICGTCWTHRFQVNDGSSEAEGRDEGILQGFYWSGGQLWRSALFIHYFIEKMSVLWFGSSQDWFVLHSRMLDTLEGGCNTTDNTELIYAPLLPPSDYSCGDLFSLKYIHTHSHYTSSKASLLLKDIRSRS